MTSEQIARELFTFADLDCSPSKSSTNTDWIFSFSQNDEKVTVSVAKSGTRVVETRGSVKTTFKSYKGLLSSPNFGNLKRFVEAQKALIVKDAPYILDLSAHLPVVGELEIEGRLNEQLTFLQSIDDWFRPDDAQHSVKTLVVDGPAGIGKTHLIRSLAFMRASAFSAGTPPPILHVQSRGLRLTGLTDVIARTLQALRISLTFDQLPILARHGLLQIAIDGFDELADPNGYDTAWGSLRDFAESIQGEGCLLLAGRDTFIDAQSVRRALPILDTPFTGSAHLRALKEAEASQWLSGRKWDERKLAALEGSGLFHEGSYALRPFFMSQIARFVEDEQEFGDFISFPLASLIAALVKREALLLKPVMPHKDIDTITGLLNRFFGEVAREMIDAESDSIDEATASLLIDFVFADTCNADELYSLRHRVASFAMLDQDITPNSRRFPHTEIKDFFAGLNIIRTISDGEKSKSIRRNIFGSDFLETFHDIIIHQDPVSVDAFYRRALEIINTDRSSDRSRRNIASLILSGISDPTVAEMEIKLSDLSLDEVFIREKANAVSLIRTDIGHLDIRGADISSVEFFECQIGTLLADATSAAPASMPTPGVLMIDDKGRSKPVVDEREVESWLSRHKPMVADTIEKTPHLALFEKLCRIVLRQNWLVISGDPDDRTTKLLNDPRWPSIEEILKQNSLVRYKYGVGVSGPKSDFVSIIDAFMFVDPGCEDSDVLRVKKLINELGDA